MKAQRNKGHAPEESLDQRSNTGHLAPEPMLLTIMQSCPSTTDEDKTHQHVQNQKGTPGILQSSESNPLVSQCRLVPTSQHRNQVVTRENTTVRPWKLPFTLFYWLPLRQNIMFHETKMQADDRNFHVVVLKYPSTIKCRQLYISPSLEENVSNLMKE